MTPPGQAVSADVSQSPAILAAIYAIGMQSSGVSFKAGKAWSMPEGDEVKAGGYPFWVVLQPRDVGGLDANAHLIVGELPRISGVSFPVADYTCYAIFPHRNVKKPETFSTPEWAKNLLRQAFTIYWTLNQTCIRAQIRECCVLPKLEFTSGGHSQPYTVVKLVLRVTEELNVSYSGPY